MRISVLTLAIKAVLLAVIQKNTDNTYTFVEQGQDERKGAELTVFGSHIKLAASFDV